MNKQYSKEEKNELIAECQQWIEEGKSISSFAQERGVSKGALYCWVQVNKSNTHSPETSLVHIPKVRKETTIDSVSPLLVEMSCGFLSFVFNKGYSQESIEATLLSFQFRAGAISEEEFLLKRREVVGKDFENLKAWLDTYDGNVLLGSPLQIAINYPLNRWEALTKFLEFSFANSENNSAERKINVYCNWT